MTDSTGNESGEPTRGWAFTKKRAEAARWLEANEVGDNHFWTYGVLTKENPNPNPGIPPALALKIFNSFVEDGLLVPLPVTLPTGCSNAYVINAAKEEEWEAAKHPRWYPIKLKLKAVVIFLVGAIAGMVLQKVFDAHF